VPNSRPEWRVEVRVGIRGAVWALRGSARGRFFIGMVVGELRRDRRACITVSRERDVDRVARDAGAVSAASSMADDVVADALVLDSLCVCNLA